MNPEQIKKQIEKIYLYYSEKMNDLKKEQDEALKNLSHELEKTKLEEIRNEIAKQNGNI